MEFEIQISAIKNFYDLDSNSNLIRIY